MSTRPDTPLANRLGQETSPYLLQHKDNPVHWQSWDAGTLERARETDTPILLSVGYSACHWCHVMAHESFEDEKIAALMNEHFINIKVDREERPDLDAIYQSALQMMGEQGGWPLTVFLTPDAEPFFGGTYFPPEPRYGRPGFPQLLPAVADAYANRKDEVTQNVAAIKEGLARLAKGGGGNGFNKDHLEQTASAYLGVMDTVHGGTEGAPKFPQAPLFRFLWRAARQNENADKLKGAVQGALDHMAQGGIYDHVGGGFARYSTDEVWLVPHFEKMLYDNAQLIELYTDAWVATKKPLYERRVHETIDWLFRDMVVKDGGAYAFASALDADSEGEEGRFYVWSEESVAKALADFDEKDISLFKKAYDVTAAGNWFEHGKSKTILNRTSYMNDSDEATEKMFTRMLEALRYVRAPRVWPGRDDKVLADWNAMTVAALAHAGSVFDNPAWVAAAKDTFGFINRRMIDGNELFHTWCAGRTGTSGVLDDYAWMALASLKLFEATGNFAFVDRAEAYVKTADALFADEDGGYFFAKPAPDIIQRAKPASDNAVPSGNGVMADVLVRLFRLTGKDSYRVRVEALFAFFAPADLGGLVSMPGMLAAWESFTNAVEIAVAGDAGQRDYQDLLRAAYRAPVPGRLIVPLGAGGVLPENHPAANKGRGGQAEAYVCRTGTCLPPVTKAADLEETLSSL